MPDVMVSRFSPGYDSEPYLQTYTLPEFDKETVLGILNYIKENLDSTIAFTFGCRNEHCGECGLRVNGKPVLACRELITNKSITIKPLARFPIIRDLVVDTGMLAEEIFKILPLPVKGGSVLPPEVYNVFFKAGRCNYCFLCQSACQLFHFDKKPVAGPAFYVMLSQHFLRPIDGRERNALYEKLFKHRFNDCNLCGNCTRFCPQEADPRRVIIMLVSYLKGLGFKMDPQTPLMQAIKKLKNQDSPLLMGMGEHFF